MQEIDEGIYYEDSLSGVTLGALFFSQGMVIIDAPLRTEDARSWRSVLMNHHGWSNRFLVSLDSHPDRTLGLRAMESTIVTHQETTEVFDGRPTIFKGEDVMTGADWEFYNEVIGMRWVVPNITFNQRLTLHWNGSEIILEHHPGPTAESIWVILPEAQVVFVGDTVVLNQPPFLANADLEIWVEELELLMKSYQNYVIISGRGGPVKKEDIHELRKFLRNVMRRMERLVNKKALPEATEKMVPSLLSKFSFPSLYKTKYTKRLQYGLHQCYLQRYFPYDALDQSV
jgi:glyoxylase-like metal-dependent hydrolase (beta-lactamase superfamily II)